MPVYGISEWDHNYIKLTERARTLNSRKQQMEGQMREAQEQLVGISGEMSALNAFVNTWTSPYGLPHGVTLECLDGNLGGGVTHLDARPLDSKASALQALAAPPAIPDAIVRSAKLGEELCAELGRYAGENGACAGRGESAVEVVRRIVSERDAAMQRLSVAEMDIALLKKRKSGSMGKPRRR
jgi:hypothetical protein